MKTQQHTENLNTLFQKGISREHVSKAYLQQYHESI
jgi:hypothetical protein